MKQTPLAPMSAKRRARLAATGVANPFTTLAAGPRQPGTPAALRARPTVNTGPDDATVEAVLTRDVVCVRCGAPPRGSRGVGWSIHHRKLRSAGVDNSLPNLILLHGSGTTGCHGWCHNHPARARDEGGWMIRRTDTPALAPVSHARYGRVWLTADGGWTRQGPSVGAV